MIFPEEVRPWAEAAYREVFVNGEPSLHESHVRRADGAELVVEARATFIEHDGKRVAMLSTIRDLTAQRHAEAERDGVLATITHDLQQPLTYIMLQASALRRQARRGTIAADELANSLEIIGSAARRVGSGLVGFLDSAQVRDGQTLGLTRRATDLVALALESVRDLQASTPAHTLSCDAEVPTLVGYFDEMRLRRVLDNLLSNGIKYSPAGGDVRVKVAYEHNTPVGPAAVISVTDQGVGIPAADLPRIFERFYRGSNVEGSVQGTGLGLAGVHQIVEHHGGTIDVTSTEGQGTTVILRLPLTTDPSQD